VKVKNFSLKTPDRYRHIKAQVDEIVKDFNRKVIRDPNYFYVTCYKGDYLYLDRYDYGGFARYASSNIPVVCKIGSLLFTNIVKIAMTQMNGCFLVLVWLMVLLKAQ
jgi:hypothetical protein